MTGSLHKGLIGPGAKAWGLAFALLLLSLVLPPAPDLTAAEVGEDRDIPTSGTIKPLEGRTIEELTKERRLRIHPYLIFSAYFTDNVFNSNENKSGDAIFVLSPGVRVFYPLLEEAPSVLRTTVTHPGAVETRSYGKRYERKIQGYLNYQVDFEVLASHSDQNTQTHTLFGLIQRNFRGGLTLSAYDKYLYSHHVRGTGLDTKLDEFHSNLLALSADYELGEKTSLGATYSWHLVDYRSGGNEFRDRTDNSISLRGSYRLRPKTTLFGQYDFVLVRYSSNTELDNNEHRLFAGVRWQASTKTSLELKAGTGVKDFREGDGGRDATHLLLTAGATHRLTEKGTLSLELSRLTHETDLQRLDYMISTQLRASYQQRLTNRLNGYLTGSVAFNDYRRDYTLNGVTKPKEDTVYQGTIGARYKMKSWLELEGGYSFAMLDSTFAAFDYTTNTIFIRARASF